MLLRAHPVHAQIAGSDCGRHRFFQQPSGKQKRILLTDESLPKANISNYDS
jgi:hypothetical protein